jgi:hypothetical protein
LANRTGLDEWSLMKTAHLHALLIGAETTANALIAQQRPYL